jgi:hypothetical protein
MTLERMAHFLREWNVAIHQYEEADREFRRITEKYLAQVDTTRTASRTTTARRYNEGLTKIEATQLARQDLFRRDAAAARQLSGERATMYGIAALVESLCSDDTQPV